MTHVLDRDALMAPAARPTTAEQLLEELRVSTSLQAENRTLLVAILAELQSWRTPSAEATGCPHPEGLQENLSSMGEKWIRCKGCGADLVRKERC